MNKPRDPWLYEQQAFDVLTSSQLVDALDLSKEDPKIRERYGDGKPYTYQYDGAATNNELLLMARRLVEVGVRCVTMTFGRWDSHGDNEGLVRHHGTRIDQAVHALVTDLEERGMLDDVLVAYGMNEEDAEAVIAYFKWIGEIDLNGFDQVVSPLAKVPPAEDTNN